MTDSETKLAAVNLLLQRGVRFRFDAPFFLRLLHLDRITIRPLYPGTIAAITIEIIKSGLQGADRKQAAERIEDIARIVAIAALNDRDKEPDKLARRLVKRVPAYQLFQMYAYVSDINDVTDFTIITGYFQRLSSQLMMRRLPGQDEKGS